MRGIDERLERAAPVVALHAGGGLEPGGRDAVVGAAGVGLPGDALQILDAEALDEQVVPLVHVPGETLELPAQLILERHVGERRVQGRVRRHHVVRLPVGDPEQLVASGREGGVGQRPRARRATRDGHGRGGDEVVVAQDVVDEPWSPVEVRRAEAVAADLRDGRVATRAREIGEHAPDVAPLSCAARRVDAVPAHAARAVAVALARPGEPRSHRVAVHHVGRGLLVARVDVEDGELGRGTGEGPHLVHRQRGGRLDAVQVDQVLGTEAGEVGVLGVGRVGEHLHHAGAVGGVHHEGAADVVDPARRVGQVRERSVGPGHALRGGRGVRRHRQVDAGGGGLGGGPVDGPVDGDPVLQEEVDETIRAQDAAVLAGAPSLASRRQAPVAPLVAVVHGDDERARREGAGGGAARRALLGADGHEAERDDERGGEDGAPHGVSPEQVTPPW